MLILTDFSYQALCEELSKYSLHGYQVTELYKWLARGSDFDGMTNLSKSLRNQLSAEYYAQGAVIKQHYDSADGTVKFLFALTDGNIVEGVLMRYKYGNTLCVSTQVGCRMGCKFCASTLEGLIRNLTCGEMFSFVALVNAYLGGSLAKREVTNVVLMGSGEPLDNYDNVLAFLAQLNDERGLNISYRNVSLSTCGIVPQIRRLADEKLGVNLTISLHNSFQEGRERLMPIAKQYWLTDLLDAAHYYFEKTGRRVIFEYTLVKGENDSDRDAVNLARITKGFPCHINLIRLNPVKERALEAASEQSARRFLDKLTTLGVSATLRRQVGLDVAGACGQLRRKFLSNEDL